MYPNAYQEVLIIKTIGCVR
ncbi:helix-turn-helix domain-containing protein, partial [Enterococcus avium]